MFVATRVGLMAGPNIENDKIFAVTLNYVCWLQHLTFPGLKLAGTKTSFAEKEPGQKKSPKQAIKKYEIFLFDIQVKGKKINLKGLFRA